MSFGRFRGALAVSVVALLLTAGAASAQDTKSTEDVTGNGGHLLRYSSKQVNVELTTAQRSAWLHARDQDYPIAQLDKVLDAIAATLAQQGYATPELDSQFHMVQARHDEVLVSKGREILRGVLKSKMPLPGRPDHQSTEALVVLTTSPDGHGVQARTQFRSTVWDSNGDSRTMVVSDPAVYRTFYSGVNAQLNKTASSQGALSSTHASR